MTTQPENDEDGEDEGIIPVDTVILHAQRAMHERDAYLAALEALMPFVLEDYHPDWATPAYRAAVEAAKKCLQSVQ